MAQKRDPYGIALASAKEALGELAPQTVAGRSGAVMQPDGAGLELAYWGCGVCVRWPSAHVHWLAGGEPPTAVQLILLHYLATADGAPLADRWVAFRELPDGRVYDDAFRRRACRPLERSFGERVPAFAGACRRLGGEPLTFGDASYLFQILPRVRVAVILHGSDDEFPAQAGVLFDASTRHYLPIEDVAVLGGMVAARILREA